MYWTLGKVDSVTVYNLNDKCRGAKRSGDRQICGKRKKELWKGHLHGSCERVGADFLVLKSSLRGKISFSASEER